MAVAVGGVWRRAGTCNVQQFHADVGASSNSMLMLVSSNSMLGPVLWRELVGWSSPKGPVSCWSSPKGPVASVHLQGIGVIVRVEVVGLSARPDFSTWSG